MNLRCLLGTGRPAITALAIATIMATGCSTTAKKPTTEAPLSPLSRILTYSGSDIGPSIPMPVDQMELTASIARSLYRVSGQPIPDRLPWADVPLRLIARTNGMINDANQGREPKSFSAEEMALINKAAAHYMVHKMKVAPTRLTPSSGHPDMIVVIMPSSQEITRLITAYNAPEATTTPGMREP